MKRRRSAILIFDQGIIVAAMRPSTAFKILPE